VVQDRRGASALDDVRSCDIPMSICRHPMHYMGSKPFPDVSRGTRSYSKAGMVQQRLVDLPCMQCMRSASLQQLQRQLNKPEQM
jgi:hypothetical protein